MSEEEVIYAYGQRQFPPPGEGVHGGYGYSVRLTKDDPGDEWCWADTEFYCIIYDRVFKLSEVLTSERSEIEEEIKRVNEIIDTMRYYSEALKTAVNRWKRYDKEHASAEPLPAS